MQGGPIKTRTYHVKMTSPLFHIRLITYFAPLLPHFFRRQGPYLPPIVWAIPAFFAVPPWWIGLSGECRQRHYRLLCATKTPRVLSASMDGKRQTSIEIIEIADVKAKKKTHDSVLWRRVRDSNPRYPQRYAGFQDRCNQPALPTLLKNGGEGGI